MKFFDIGGEAVGFIAIGQQATGVIAIGQIATGVIAVGQLARGGFVVGQLAIGLCAIGQLSAGALFCIGMLGAGGWGTGFTLELIPPIEKKRKMMLIRVIGQLVLWFAIWVAVYFVAIIPLLQALAAA